MRLNKSQCAAIHYISGPCLILAGAGSGKTRVIINKIVHLIRDIGFLPRQIVAVTFTNKAAREMKERIMQVLLRQEMRGLHISTFHTLGLEIIKKEHRLLNLKGQFSLFDDRDQFDLLRDITGLDLKGEKEQLKALQTTISNWKNRLILPEKALEMAKNSQEMRFAHYYHQYDQQLKACNILDFDDLILLPTLLLTYHQEARARWQQKIRYLLVDEYQDTNTSQYELIKLLVGDRSCFTVVGDDDQSIYSWRGARPRNLSLLNNDFPDLKVIKMEQNYRSTEIILKAANILIANNPHIFDKKLFSEREEGEKIRIFIGKDEKDEAEKVINDLLGHRFSQGTKYRDYAILYRGNHQGRLFEQALIRKHIPYRITGETSFYARTEIKDILAYLRILVNPDDDNAFIRMINTPKREIGPVTLRKLSAWAKQCNKSLLESSFDIGLTEFIAGTKLETLTSFTAWIQQLGERINLDPIGTLDTLFAGINYESWLCETSSTPKAAQARLRNVMQLYDWLKEWLQGDDKQEALTLEQAIARFTLRDMLARNDAEEDQDEIQLMTLHASKGLEFPYVYIVGMEEGILPHQNSIDEDDHVEEERRLAYVGITRAQSRLTFSLSKTRTRFGELIHTEQSRFLLELPQDDLDWANSEPASPEVRLQKGKAHLAAIKARIAAAK